MVSNMTCPYSAKTAQIKTLIFSDGITLYTVFILNIHLTETKSISIQCSSGQEKQNDSQPSDITSNLKSILKMFTIFTLSIVML